MQTQSQPAVYPLARLSYVLSPFCFETVQVQSSQYLSPATLTMSTKNSDFGLDVLTLCHFSGVPLLTNTSMIGNRQIN